MVAPCCWCGIPLQRATQYVGIADIILGILNFIFVVIHIKEVVNNPEITIKYGEGDGSGDSYGYSHSSYRSRPTRGPRTFPGFDILPLGVCIAIAVCYGLQFLMGIFLYIGAVNKHRPTIILWMIVAALTALFTGLFIRLYEMIIVNEFARELKQEEEVTYFPGHQHQAQPAAPVPAPVSMQPTAYQGYPNNLVPPIDAQLPSSVNVISGNAYPYPCVQGQQYPTGGGYQNMGYIPSNGQPQPLPQPGQVPGQGPHFPSVTQVQFQFQYEPGNVPPNALQPPPNYEEVVRQPPFYSGGSTVGQGYTSQFQGQAGGGAGIGSVPGPSAPRQNNTQGLGANNSEKDGWTFSKF